MAVSIRFNIIVAPPLLNHEIISRIGNYLDSQSVVASTKVCRIWRDSLKKHLEACREDCTCLHEGYQPALVQACRSQKLSLSRLPVLNLGNRMGWTDYIDFLTEKDLTSPLMRFVDRDGRPGIAMRVRARKEILEKIELKPIRVWKAILEKGTRKRKEILEKIDLKQDNFLRGSFVFAYFRRYPLRDPSPRWEIGCKDGGDGHSFFSPCYRVADHAEDKAGWNFVPLSKQAPIAIIRGEDPAFIIDGDVQQIGPALRAPSPVAVQGTGLLQPAAALAQPPVAVPVKGSGPL